MTAEDLARKVEELESQAAFQEQLHQQLDATVARQDREILELKQQVRVLSERLRELRDAASAPGPVDEAPPHY